ncbi:hypothetical protein B5X24_HaOG204909 [Helicoverpa armigera]|uniref:Uncharacterized protein n=1 Tax=Helicoverpa armigera TaxID=29058 RepID=A0A2W1BME2_HELAM|nr:hypothetical protein B5X24_HaOG204909 [Helicoverpa armigera]
MQLGWAAFGKLHNVFSYDIPQCLKMKVFNQCVLPAMTYGTETWSLTVGLILKVKVAQRAMEKAMLGVSLTYEMRSKLNWHRTGHAARRADELEKCWSGDHGLATKYECLTWVIVLRFQ